jgi:hypothetical protein
MRHIPPAMPSLYTDMFLATLHIYFSFSLFFKGTVHGTLLENRGKHFLGPFFSAIVPSLFAITFCMVNEDLLPRRYSLAEDIYYS